MYLKVKYNNIYLKCKNLQRLVYLKNSQNILTKKTKLHPHPPAVENSSASLVFCKIDFKELYLHKQ